jgi:hypothetical protein
MTGKIENCKGIQTFVPNNTFDLKEKGCYVSYNSSIRDYGWNPYNQVFNFKW